MYIRYRLVVTTCRYLCIYIADTDNAMLSESEIEILDYRLVDKTM